MRAVFRGLLFGIVLCTLLGKIRVRPCVESLKLTVFHRSIGVRFLFGLLSFENGPY